VNDVKELHALKGWAKATAAGLVPVSARGRHLVGTRCATGKQATWWWVADML